MKLTKIISSLAIAAVVALGLLGAPNLRAEDKKPEPPKPTIEQRVTAMEAYFSNTDPAAAVKGADGKIPEGLTTVAGSNPGPGHNGFMMICAALVLFMTLPGLALFYGGLVRKKNVLSVCAQCLGIAGLVTVLWWAVGYSLVFGGNFTPAEGTKGLFGFILGGTDYLFLKGVGAAPNTTYAAWPSQSVFSMYQLMFAIITPALIVGAIAERMKFSAIILFVTIWMFVVYFPMAHMVWGGTGLMNGVWNADAKIPAIDFAGGTVVHMTSGWSALILCIILGKRLGFGKEKMSPHSMVLCMVGTGMLWVGWYGFNAGSALAADGVASNAFMTTTLAAATAGAVWGLMEKILKGHASVLGMCSGIVAGLVVITPACGFVTASGAMLIGVLAAVVPYIFVMILKAKFGYDDALDTFGVHAIGGTLGAIMTGVLATVDSGNLNLVGADYALKNGLAKAGADGVAVLDSGKLLISQLTAVGITLVISIVGTIVIALIVKAVIGLRPTPEEETVGLDLTDHQEEGYVL
ncbi:MAG: ammonium transporter [Verrucomicrobia bacterium]|nr:ammonium transporter [Verrucomicrobiota bacterium]